MDTNRLTEKAQQALQAAQAKAVRYSHQQIDVEHLLTALLEQDGGLASAVLNKAETPVDSLRERLEQEDERPLYDVSAQDVLRLADQRGIR